MNYSQFFNLTDVAGMSPEQMGAHLDISGMTIRRWRKMRQVEELPSYYAKTVVDGINRLIHQGVISVNSPEVQNFLKNEGLASFEAVLGTLGISGDFMKRLEASSGDKDSDSMVVQGLAQIGTDELKMQEVENNEKKIISFKKFSQTWSNRITTLMQVIRSKKFSTFEKFAAYGALFYLLNPLDLIPDHLPLFGLVDDFAILGIAVAYYLKNFKQTLNS